MKEQGQGIQEQPVLEGEILPPITPEMDRARVTTPEGVDPVVHLNFITQVNEIAAKDPDIALTYIVNYQPVVEAKHPIEELFEKATEGLLKGTDKAVRGAVGLVNYRSLARAEKPATRLKTPTVAKAPQRPMAPAHSRPLA